MTSRSRLRRVYVAGHTGLVGRTIATRIRTDPMVETVVRTRAELDLTNRSAVLAFFQETKPEDVVVAAARVGGIAANMAAPVQFLLENLKIQNNVLEACLEHRVERTVLLGSSCVYPREASQPMRESFLLQGPFEPTNEAYAVAKLAGIKLAQAMHAQYGLRVILPVPSNLYGPGDHFELDRAHVVSALVRRFVDAKDTGEGIVTLWGSGSARREFLHVDDLADALLFLLERYDDPDIINVGTGTDVTIHELAELVAEVVEYDGDIRWDRTRPDGMPQKLLDVSRIQALGWHHRIELPEGIRSVVGDYRARAVPT